ncbi:MAG: SRPBCC domain-containing protein [Pirellulales bacterium]
MKHQLKTFDLKVERTIPASCEELFDGWLDPRCPGTPWSMAAKLIMDAKVDGLFYWLYINEAGEHKPHYGRFTIIERPWRIEYTWMSLHTQGIETLVSVEFQETDGQTLMTLRHEKLPEDEIGKGHEKGWGKIIGEFASRYDRPR